MAYNCSQWLVCGGIAAAVHAESDGDGLKHKKLAFSYQLEPQLRPICVQVQTLPGRGCRLQNTFFSFGSNIETGNHSTLHVFVNSLG